MAAGTLGQSHTNSTETQDCRGRSSHTTRSDTSAPSLRIIQSDLAGLRGSRSVCSPGVPSSSAVVTGGHELTNSCKWLQRSVQPEAQQNKEFACLWASCPALSRVTVPQTTTTSTYYSSPESLSSSLITQSFTRYVVSYRLFKPFS